MSNTRTKIILALLSLLLINIGIVEADAITIDWQKTYTDGIEIASVKQTSDGGYIFVQWNIGSGTVLVKTNSSGSKQWSKIFTDISPDSVIQTSDGYVFVGIDTPTFTNSILTKTDSSGNKKWSKTFPNGHLYSVIQSHDGGYIATGRFGTYPNYDIWVIKTDSSGNKLWDKKFGGTTLDSGKDIKRTRDGGYIISGGINYDPTLVKIDSAGNRQWSKTYVESDVAYATSVQQTSDGGYIITGDENSYNAHLIKTDSSGNKQWGRTYRVAGDPNLLANRIKIVQQTNDGGYIIGGYAEYDDIASNWKNGLIIKTDSLGNKQWFTELGKDINSLEKTRDGGYILGGLISGSNSWLAKLGSDYVNLLKNPGFEESYGGLPRYWAKYQTGTKAIFKYPEIGRTGTGKSVSIQYTTKETGKVALWQQTGIVVVPSKKYKLSGYMKLSGVTGGGSASRYNGASLRVNWYRSDGGLIKTDLITKNGTSEWVKYEKTFTAPSNAIKATVGGDLFNAAGKVWFDDLSFVKIS